MTDINNLHQQAVALLQQLISIPSFSREENRTADLLENFLKTHGILPNRKANNLWAYNKYFDEAKPTILLNSHHDTVKPSELLDNTNKDLQKPFKRGS